MMWFCQRESTSAPCCSPRPCWTDCPPQASKNPPRFSLRRSRWAAADLVGSWNCVGRSTCVNVICFIVYGCIFSGRNSADWLDVPSQSANVMFLSIVLLWYEPTNVHSYYYWHDTIITGCFYPTTDWSFPLGLLNNVKVNVSAKTFYQADNDDWQCRLVQSRAKKVGWWIDRQYNWQLTLLWYMPTILYIQPLNCEKYQTLCL